MTDRYFCPDLSGQAAILSDSEAHHAIHVMRLKSGDRIELFDGAGTAASSIVTRVSRRDVEVAVESTRFSPPREQGGITVAAAPPKGDRLKWMIEKLTEIGVDRFVPLQTTRTVVDPRKSRLDKLQAAVVAASKQCRRNWLMQIESTQQFDTLLNSTTGRIIMAHPAVSGDEDAKPFGADSDVTLLIGPEGGFTDEEVAAAGAHGVHMMPWPNTILRTETAAMVFATMAIAATRVPDDDR